jgi:hypothetical protein
MQRLSFQGIDPGIIDGQSLSEVAQTIASLVADGDDFSCGTVWPHWPIPGPWVAGPIPSPWLAEPIPSPWLVNNPDPVPWLVNNALNVVISGYVSASKIGLMLDKIAKGGFPGQAVITPLGMARTTGFMVHAHVGAVRLKRPKSGPDDSGYRQPK